MCILTIRRHVKELSNLYHFATMDMETRALTESETVPVYESSRSSIRARRRHQQEEQEDRNDSDDMQVDIESQQRQSSSSSLREGGGEECPVCMEVMHDNALRVQRCGHLICAQCYRQWTTSCPICRGPMLRMVHEVSGRLLPRVLPELTELEAKCCFSLFGATIWSLSSSMVVSFLLHWLPQIEDGPEVWLYSFSPFLVVYVGCVLCDQDGDTTTRGMVGCATLTLCLYLVYFQLILAAVSALGHYVMTWISLLVIILAFVGFCHVAQRLAVEWNDLDRKPRGAIILAAFLVIAHFGCWLTILYFVLKAASVFCVLLLL